MQPRISPSVQLFLAACAGSAAASAVDLLLNGPASGVAKAAGIAGPPAPALTAAAWVGLGFAGAATTAYFRPLTRRSAFALAFGAAAVFAMLIPR